jgi:hypothetical protein
LASPSAVCGKRSLNQQIAGDRRFDPGYQWPFAYLLGTAAESAVDESPDTVLITHPKSYIVKKGRYFTL